jgi:uncharacterized protein YlxW (UPF0749 family)
VSSRPDTAGSEEARLPRPPGPPDDPADREEPPGAPEPGEAIPDAAGNGSPSAATGIPGEAPAADESAEAPSREPVEEPAGEPVDQPVGQPVDETVSAPVEPVDEPLDAAAGQPVDHSADQSAGRSADQAVERVDEPVDREADQDPVAASLLPRDAQVGPEQAPRTAARGRLSRAMRPRASRAQLLAGLLCALLGFALVVQARQTQTQGLDQLRQTDLVRLLDNVTNAEARAEQDVRSEQALRDSLLSGSDSSEAAQQAAQQRLDTLGLLAGTVAASGPGIELEITDPRRQIDSSVLLDTLEELRDGGAEVVQIGDVRVVAATAFTDDAEGVRVDGRLLTPPYLYKVIGEPQTLAKVLQIPGGVLDVLRSKGAQGRVAQPPTVRVDALRAATTPQYARPAPGGTP